MNRKKVTISVSKKVLELIDRFGITTGLDARSRVIEESIFAIAELLAYRRNLTRQAQSAIKPSLSQQEALSLLFMYSDVISKNNAVLDRFERFSLIKTEEKTK